jgi:hypothetical protein
MAHGHWADLLFLLDQVPRKYGIAPPLVGGASVEAALREGGAGGAGVRAVLESVVTPALLGGIPSARPQYPVQERMRSQCKATRAGITQLYIPPLHLLSRKCKEGIT